MTKTDRVETPSVGARFIAPWFRSVPSLEWTAIVAILATAALADQPQPMSALARMPVREITVFKDGHAFVLHSGQMPTDPSGNVQMDYLPYPVLGTFWPYSADKRAKLQAVTARQRQVVIQRTSLTIREMLESNVGAEVTFVRVDGKTITGKIVAVPERSSEELEASDPPGSASRLPEKGGVVELQTGEGVAVIGIDTIRDAIFKGNVHPRNGAVEFRNLLTLKLDWQNVPPAKTADVGMVYLQKGVRWIPGYRVTIDGKGGAIVKLQATLLNELTDLNDVTVHLVVGVPSFYFKDTADPIGLQQVAAQLSPYFQQANAQTGYAFSNAIMSQSASARMGEYRSGGLGGGGAFGPGGGPAAAPDLGPEVAGSDRSEDLYVYTVKHVTLKRGARMVLPVAEFPLKYRDVYTLDLPVTPPRGLRPNGGNSNEQQAELARLMEAARAIHKLRLTNNSKYPLTTAPALIVNGDTLLGQSMMTYTSVGGETDLTITTATEIKVKKTDKETGRTPNAGEWRGVHLQRVDMAGTIALTNYASAPVDVEVTRSVLGMAGKADSGGTAANVNALEDDEAIAYTDQPSWWRWYNWPEWWGRFNAVGRFTWKVKLAPNKPTALGYTWFYLWE